MDTLHAFVGDIHGCHDALRHLEDRVARHAAREGLEPRIVSIGDLVDRGPDSAAVVRHFRLRTDAGTHRALLGNHEQIMLAALWSYRPELLQEAGCRPPRAVQHFDEVYDRQRSPTTKWFPRPVYRWWSALLWLGQGGVPTLESYGVREPTDPDDWQVDPDDLRFLCGLPLVFRTEGVVATHALTTADGLADLDSDDDETFIRAAELALWGRSRPDEPPDAGRTHVSGHSILPRPRRDRRRQLVQIDTGAFLGRRLTAWCAETDRMVSVPNPDAGVYG